MAVLSVNGKAILCAITFISVAKISSSQTYSTRTAQQQQQQEAAYNHEMNWPVTLNYHETKTNALLGEALLKKIYARIGFSDNIIRAEVDTLFENLKEVIEKRLKKCERKRRRAGNVRNSPYEAMYGHMNATLAHQYNPQRRMRHQQSAH